MKTLTDVQAQKTINAKLAQVEVLFAEAAALAEENGIEFSYGFDGMGGGSYVPKKVAWDSSTASCAEANGESIEEALYEGQDYGWVSSSANC